MPQQIHLLFPVFVRRTTINFDLLPFLTQLLFILTLSSIYSLFWFMNYIFVARHLNIHPILFILSSFSFWSKNCHKSHSIRQLIIHIRIALTQKHVNFGIWISRSDCTRVQRDNILLTHEAIHIFKPLGNCYLHLSSHRYLTTKTTPLLFTGELMCSRKQIVHTPIIPPYPNDVLSAILSFAQIVQSLHIEVMLRRHAA